MLASVLLASLFVASNAYTLKVRAPDVSYCQDGSEDWFGNIVLNINPWPVHIAANEVLSIDGGIDIMQTVEVGSQLKIELALQTALGDLPIPCLPVSSTFSTHFLGCFQWFHWQIEDLQIGSCTYPVEQLLADAAMLGICDMLMPEGQACELPLNPGSYAPGDQAVEVTLPEIPAALEPFLKGNIKAKAIGIKPDGTEIACLSVTLELN